MTRRYTIVLAAAVACAVAVLALTLSGGEDTKLVSSSAIAKAAGTTEKVKGFTVDMRMSIGVEGLDEPLHVNLAGVQDKRGQSARLVGAYEDFPKEVPGQDEDGRVPIEMVVIYPVIYMKSPLFEAQLPEGKEWLSYDQAKISEKLGIGDPTQLQQSDPSEFVRYLRAASDRVEPVGKEDVRGVETTHYRATVDLRKVPDTLPAGQRESARKAIEKLIDLGAGSEFPTEVWIDGDSLLRRMRFQMEMTQQGKTIDLDMTMEMYDFGPKQKAKAPPAGEVHDITDEAAVDTP